MFCTLRLKNLSFIFDELSVLVSLWLDWAFFSEVITVIRGQEVIFGSARSRHFIMVKGDKGKASPWEHPWDAAWAAALEPSWAAESARAPRASRARLPE